MFKRILLAVDGSEHSIRATDYSIAIAQKFGGTIDAVYVVDSELVKKEALRSTSQFEIEKKRREKTEPVRKRLDEAKVIYGTHNLHGDPGPTIAKFANEREFDCVVIGSRGLNQLQSFILGSVSQHVVKRANCPVLIIK